MISEKKISYIPSLTPARKKPFRLWNPIDYFDIFIWSFQSPQYFHWYKQKYQNQKETKGRNPLVALKAQSLVLVALIMILVFYWTRSFEVAQNAIIFPIVTALFFSSIYILQGKIATGVAGGTILGIAIVAILSDFSSYNLTLLLEENPARAGYFTGVMWGIVSGGALGIIFGLIASTRENHRDDASTWSLAIAGFCLLIFFTAGLILLIILWIRYNFLFSSTLILSFGIAFTLSILIGFYLLFNRVLAYLIGIIPALLHWNSKKRPDYNFGKYTTYAVPGLYKTLVMFLDHDPKNGFYIVKQLLDYTRQISVVRKALLQWCGNIKPEEFFLMEKLLIEYTDIVSFLRKETPFYNRNTNLKEQHKIIVAYDEFNSWINSSSLNTNTSKKILDAFIEIENYPHSSTLYKITKALTSAESSKGVKSIAKWSKYTRWIEETTENPIRKETVSAMKDLYSISLEVAVSNESVSKLNRSASLGRALGNLSLLIEKNEKKTDYPEIVIVRRIAESWRHILAKEAGKIGKIVVEKIFDNPFVAGNPVEGDLFVGRDDIFRRLEELWGTNSERQVPSVVLYGHRRMGKTSILKNLGQYRFGVKTLVSYFSMQRLGGKYDTGEFLLAIAYSIYDTFSDANISLSEPDVESFSKENPNRIFNRYLKQIEKARNGYRIILAIDEFELLETAIENNRVDDQILDYLRGIIQNIPWIILAFAGLHTLEEMVADYWNPLFSSVVPVKVSFLTLEATTQLLANPSDDFPLNFTKKTVQRTYDWVQGQPFLTQLVGHTLVRRFQSTEELERSKLSFGADAIDAIVDSAIFYEQGEYYFNGVWKQARASSQEGEIAILQLLAQADKGMKAKILFSKASLGENEGQDSLTALIRHDVITDTEPHDFTVPLMRYWIRKSKTH
jgi:hypothetical protein